MTELIIPLATLLLGAGGVSFVQSLLTGVGTLRGGARAREREAVDDLARARDKADGRAERAEADRDFWRDIAGRWRFQLVTAGIEPVPLDPVPPSTRGAM